MQEIKSTKGKTNRERGQSILSANFNDPQSTIHERGFTLIEMIVAVALFTVVATVSVGSLLSIVDANRKAQSLKSVMDNLHFALQGMSLALQVGRDYDCDLLAFVHDNATDCNGGKQLEFRSADNKQVVYSYNGTSIERSIDGSPLIRITAEEVDIEEFNFYVVGSGSEDGKQPLAIITVKGTAGDFSEKTKTSFFVQTAVSSRRFDD